MKKTKVLVADDHPLFREGLRSFIDLQDDMEIIGEAGNGIEAVEKAFVLTPDVVIMDIKMPELDGISAAKQIRAKHPGIGIVVLTTFEQEYEITECIKAGINSYLLKDAPPQDLLKAIRGISRGESLIDPKIAFKIVVGFSGYLSRGSIEEVYQDFTRRELQVLKMVAAGLSDAEIARKLFISQTTVRTHLSNIYQKLGVSNRTKAALHALRYGLIELDKND